MLTMSSKGRYGLSAIFELALYYGKKSINIAEIAKRQQIPTDYLRQLLVVLKKGGLVESIRGTKGGYVLARPPSAITVKEIIGCLEGATRAGRVKFADEVLTEYWKRCSGKTEEIFDTTLEELVAEKQKFEGNSIYYI